MTTLTSAKDDYLQGIIDLVPSDALHQEEKIIDHLLALWFASIHQPAMVRLLKPSRPVLY